MPTTFPHFINGSAVQSGPTFEKWRPSDGSLVGLIHEGGADEIDQAVTAARSAMNGPWGALPVPERAALLHRVADEIRRRSDDFVAAEAADTGQPLSTVSHAFIPRGGANFDVFADAIANVPTETFVHEGPHGTAINYSLRVPKGVVGVICPWNAPFLLMTWKVAPALAAGNAVVVKPSEETPGTATLLGEVMRDVGVPDGVYNVVHGFGPDSAGAALTSHPGVDAITFTGETRTGEAIMASAAKGMRDVSFELGGKNAGIVFADSDIDAAMEGLGRAAFLNCGQICLGTERIYVERPRFDEFVERFAERARDMRAGDPANASTNLGPLISQEHHDKVMSYYKLAIDEGAEVVCGGGVPNVAPPFSSGFWVEPTIWTGLAEDSRTQKEEIFGPCAHIAPFDDADEAIALANDTKYGLSTSIWTSDLTTAHTTAAGVDVGITYVNSWFLRDLRTPFGGSKQSGIGREGGVHSFEFYTELRNVCVQL